MGPHLRPGRKCGPITLICTPGDNIFFFFPLAPPEKTAATNFFFPTRLDYLFIFYINLFFYFIYFFIHLYFFNFSFFLFICFFVFAKVDYILRAIYVSSFNPNPYPKEALDR